jgi:predicted Zn finger-like uncharacterized protein
MGSPQSYGSQCNMRWITRCPSCGVIYQLVPDQLKVAQGWLRCGQCQAAFDSTGLVVASPVGAHKTETPEAAAMDAGRLNIDDLSQARRHPFCFADAAGRFARARCCA